MATLATNRTCLFCRPFPLTWHRGNRSCVSTSRLSRERCQILTLAWLPASGQASASSTRERTYASSSPLPCRRLGICPIELAHELPHERQFERLVARAAGALRDPAARLITCRATKADQ